MKLLVSREGASVLNLMFLFEEFVMNLLALTLVFRKSEIFLRFVFIRRSFYRRRSYAEYLKVKGASFGQLDEPI